MSSPHTSLDLAELLKQLPISADEPMVCNNFITHFLEYLGFNPLTDIVREFSTGGGNKQVDYALRKSDPTLPFISLSSKNSLPEIILEAKGRATEAGFLNLSYGTAKYKSTVRQLTGYFKDPNCSKSVKWGIITNGNHIQVFRKHGKAVHPVMPCVEINPENVIEIADQIKHWINYHPKALTIAVYNNKGGVGKTTTTINLASVLSLAHKKVLVIDFDPHQMDLTHSININIPHSTKAKNTLYDALYKSKTIPINNAIAEYRTEIIIKGKKEIRGFDIIPASPGFQSISTLSAKFNPKSMGKSLISLKNNYDYILIDTPPNWNFFSESAVYAADVVLIPTKHNNIYSLENAALAIANFIPEVQEARQAYNKLYDFGPIALPIFFNGGKMNDVQKVKIQQEIQKIIDRYKLKKDDKPGTNLEPYFFPKMNPGILNKDIFCLPEYEIIAKYAFSQKPATYAHKTAFEYYAQLAQEYFI